MDKREELSRLIKGNVEITFGKIYLYSNIPDKAFAKAAKNFDQHLNPNNVVAICDTTLTGNGKTGMIFMVAGAYYREMFEKTFYFNYGDIADIKIIPDKKGRTATSDATIAITFTDGNTLFMGPADFQKESIKNLLLKLKAKVATYSDVVSFKQTGNVDKLGLSEKQAIKCNAIIHGASVTTGGIGAGLAQIPLADTALITPIQVGMVISIGAVFGIEVTEAIAKGLVTGAIASLAGRGVAQLLVGWIPGIGNVINASTAAGLTEAIGWMAVAHFFNQQQEYKAKYKVDGMKQGYAEASEEYEAKLRKQADMFLKQQKVYEAEVAKYRELLSQYEDYIEELEKKLARKEDSKEAKNSRARLNTSKEIYRQLTNLKVG